MTWQQHLVVVFSILFYAVALVAALGCIVYIYKTLANSVSRNAYTTIDENELCIVKALLTSHGTLLDEEKVRDDIANCFKKRKA
jgi:hypothetical protein